MLNIAFTPQVPPIVIALLALLSVGLIGYGLYRRARGALVRALPAAALLIAVADPQFVRETRSPLKDIAVVVVDESDSQKLGERAARTEKALAALTQSLGESPDLEIRTVRAGRTEAGSTATQDGTRLFGALTSALSDIPVSRYAGAIMITDGEVHDALTPDKAREVHAPYMGAPLHAMISGDRNEYDRRVKVESAPDFGLVGSRVTMKLRVDDTGRAAASRVPVIIKRNGGAANQIFVTAGVTTDVPLAIENAGPNVFEIEAAAGQNELSAINNRTMVSISGVRDRLKVLLVSGEPHVGERAWRNLLKSDPNVDLVHFTILRPLNKDDGTPLNELSLIAFPIRELFEDQLNEFNLIIFDRYSQRGLVPAQYMANVANFVNQGGAVMLAVGPEYADSYSLFGGPLQSVLPAEPTGRIYTGAIRPKLSDAGLRHPVTEDLDGARAKNTTAPNPAQNPTWGRWLRQVEVAKPKGSKVMEGLEKEPLLILDRIGKGRVALLLSDTIWLWGKGFEGGGPETELLRRTAHWLMKEPELEEESLSATAQGGSLTINRHSLTAAEVPVTVTLPSGAEKSVLPKATTGGRFQTTMPIDESGLYHLSDGKTTALAAIGTPNPLESYDVAATADKLAPLAETTGGGVYWLQDGTVPTIRRVEPNRASHGSTWLGLKANNQYVVTGLSQTPLAPVGLLLLLVMAGAMFAWWCEGR